MSARPPVTSIAIQWRIFEEAVISPTAPPIQHREMRLAFYGGCHTILSMQLGLALANASEDEALEQMKEWFKEGEQFKKDLLAEQDPAEQDPP